ncbi:MAG: YlxR family protein [Armatimonas sp.]
MARTPIRTCVACRQAEGKRGLVRVVRLPEGAGVALDPSGKAAGRGAYVHASAECIELAVKRKALERSLKASLPETLLEELRAFAI